MWTREQSNWRTWTSADDRRWRWTSERSTVLTCEPSSSMYPRRSLTANNFTSSPERNDRHHSNDKHWNISSIVKMHLRPILPDIDQQLTHHLCNQLPTSLGIPHPNYSSTSQRPSFEHAGLTCYTLLSFSITVSLWAQNLPFQKILSSTLVCFCLSDWSHGSRPFTGLNLLISFMFCFYLFLLSVIPRCSWLSWPALWSTYGHTI